MTGTVYLVGAGPGHPDLLTVRARRVLDRADVILFDSLTTPELRVTFPEDARAIDVGKRPDEHGERTTQADIHELMIEHATAGRDVVRLKGGDPMIYGRGGEEAEVLAAASVPIEIVPGVSSSIAAPGIVGIPLTHRDHASSLAVVTGHEASGKSESSLDWSALANVVTAGGTLVILMGVRSLPTNTRRLREQGVDPDTPVAMVQKATWEDEQVVTGTLETICEVRDERDIEPPATIVVGDVVRVRSRVKEALSRGQEHGPVLRALASFEEASTISVAPEQ